MTEDTARFCASCGAPLATEGAFCGSCGARVPAAAAAPEPAASPAPEPASAVTYAPPSPTEQLLAVLGGLTIATGFMGLKRTSYTLVMTNARVIFAQLTPEMLKSVIEQARAEKKAEGGGFFKQWGAQIAASFTYAERYWQMTPDAALAETAGNFALDRSAIEKVQLRPGAIREDGQNDPDVIKIKAAGTKYKLEVSSGSFAQAKEALVRAGLI